MKRAEPVALRGEVVGAGCLGPGTVDSERDDRVQGGIVLLDAREVEVQELSAGDLLAAQGGGGGGGGGVGINGHGELPGAG